VTKYSERISSVEETRNWGRYVVRKYRRVGAIRLKRARRYDCDIKVDPTEMKCERMVLTRTDKYCANPSGSLKPVKRFDLRDSGKPEL
jgi:hypothetical protein